MELSLPNRAAAHEEARLVPPRARTDELVVQELPDETLVYDLKRHRAYCLNRTAAQIWRQCDGRATVADMARSLEAEFKTPVNGAVVWLALRRLDRARLLQERIDQSRNQIGYSRRQMIRQLALIGGFVAVLPMIQSIVAPTAASAVTCVSNCTNKPDCTRCSAGGGQVCTKVCWKGNCVGKILSGCP